MKLEVNTILDSQTPISRQETQAQKIYSFINESAGLTFDLSDCFAILKVTSIKYLSFEKYIKIFTDLIDLYKTNFSYFSTKRFGIRKVNICLLDDKSHINEYFSQNILHFYNELPNVDSLVSTANDSFTTNSYCINFQRAIHQGRANNDILYRILIDIDAYSQNSSQIDKLLTDKKELTSMNNTIFEIFKSALTPTLLSALSGGEFDLSGIIGVESNE